MPLTVDELAAITNIVEALQPDVRGEFLVALEAAMAGCERGPGILHRTAVSLLPSYFHPPAPKPPPQFFNSRKSSRA